MSHEVPGTPIYDSLHYEMYGNWPYQPTQPEPAPAWPTHENIDTYPYAEAAAAPAYRGVYQVPPTAPIGQPAPVHRTETMPPSRATTSGYGSWFQPLTPASRTPERPAAPEPAPSYYRPYVAPPAPVPQVRPQRRPVAAPPVAPVPEPTAELRYPSKMFTGTGRLREFDSTLPPDQEAAFQRFLTLHDKLGTNHETALDEQPGRLRRIAHGIGTLAASITFVFARR